MGTIQAKANPQSRIDVGESVIERAKSTSTKPVRKQFAAFTALHRAYKAKAVAADTAEAKAVAAEEKVAEADVDQDAAVDALATARAGEGAARTKPFADLGFDSPTAIKETGYAAEAKLVKKLAAAAAKKGRAATKSAARNADRAATAVESALKAVPPLKKAAAAARAQRDALSQSWLTALARLKRATRTAEDDGARGLFAALFEVAAPARKPKTKKAAAPAPTNGSPAPGAPTTT